MSNGPSQSPEGNMESKSAEPTSPADQLSQAFDLFQKGIDKDQNGGLSFSFDQGFRTEADKDNELKNKASELKVAMEFSVDSTTSAAINKAKQHSEQQKLSVDESEIEEKVKENVGEIVASFVVSMNYLKKVAGNRSHEDIAESLDMRTGVFFNKMDSRRIALKSAESFY